MIKTAKITYIGRNVYALSSPESVSGKLITPGTLFGIILSDINLPYPSQLIKRGLKQVSDPGMVGPRATLPAYSISMGLSRDSKGLLRRRPV